MIHESGLLFWATLYIDYYSFTDYGEMEGWVYLVDWPIDDSLPTSATTVDRAHNMESTPAETDIVTTELRRHLDLVTTSFHYE